MLSYLNLESLLVMGQGGNDTFTLNGDVIATTLEGADGNDTFIVNGLSAPTNILGGPNPATLTANSPDSNQQSSGPNKGAAAGNDTFIINGAGAPLSVFGYNGSDTFVVNGNGAVTSLNGGEGQDSFTVNGNSANLTLTGGPTINTFTVNSNSADLVINSTLGTNTYSIANIASGVIINSGSSTATYTVTEPLFAPITITGGTTIQALVVNGTTGNDIFTISASMVSMVGGAPITYSNLVSITINGRGGNDVFTVAGNSAPTLITGGAGNDVFNVQTISFPLTIKTGTGQSTVNLGSLAPATGGSVDQLQAPIIVTGSGLDTLNIYDSASSFHETAVLTDTSLVGLGFGTTGLSYSGIANLNISLGSGLGSGNGSFTVNATASKTATTITTGATGVMLNVQSTAGPLTLHAGTGATTYNFNGIAPAPSFTVIVDTNGKPALKVGNTITDLSGVAQFATSDLTAQLTAGQVSQDLVSAFAATGGGIPLSTSATVVTNTSPAGTTWTITDAADNATYLVLVDTNGVLAVEVPHAISTPATTAQLETELNAAAASHGTVTQDLINAFAAIGLQLSTVSTITADSAASWSIHDTVNNATYVVLVNNGVLAVQSTVQDLTNVAPVSIHQLETELNGGVFTAHLVSVFKASGQTISANGQSILAATLAGTAWSLTAGSTTDIIQVDTNGQLGLNVGGNISDLTLPAGLTTTQVISELNALALNGGAITSDLVSLLGLSTTTGAVSLLTAPVGTTWTLFGNVQGLRGAITISGSGGDTLNLNDIGDPNPQTLGLTSSSITGLGTAGIQNSGVASINMTLGSGGDNVTLAAAPNPVAVNVNAGVGNDTINVRSTLGPTTINTGGGANGVNVGSLAPATGGNLNAIQGALTLTGSGQDTVNFDDSGSAAGKTAILSGSNLTALSPAAISYSGAAAVNVSLGSGNDTFTITGTSAATSLNSGAGNDTINVNAISNPTTVNTATGTSTVNVGNPGSVSGIRAVLTITGAGNDVLNVNDTADAAANTVAISSNLIALSDSSSISYTGIKTLNVTLGTGGNTVTVTSTGAATTNLNTGAGNDTVTEQSATGALNIDTAAGANNVFVQGTAATTSITSTSGTIHVTIGSAAPASVTGIQGHVTATGTSASDTLVVDDSGSGLVRTGIVTSSTVTGLGMGPMGVTYSGFSSLVINLSAAGNNFTVASTAPGTPTTINGGAGNDTFTIQSDGGLTTINTGGGSDTVVVPGTGAAATTNINTTNAGVTSMTVGSNGIVDNVLGPITLAGGTHDSLLVDDSANTVAKVATLTAISLKIGSAGLISFGGLASLTVNFGKGGDTVTVLGTPASIPTVLNSAGGNDSITVAGNSGPLTLNTGSGANTVLIEATGRSSDH